jgi:hypothetical protein
MREYILLSDRVTDLFDYAVAHPNGFTKDDIEADLGWEPATTQWVARNLRLTFADDDINLVCEPQGQGERWLYKLVGNPDDARIWATNRTADLESRLRTMAAVASSLENATDGRTVEGRKARKIHRSLARLVEDLEDITTA